MSHGDTMPTQPLPDWEPGERPRRRRRAWPWLVALGVIVLLLVIAWFAAEAFARDVVTRTIKQEVSDRLALPAGHEVDVVVPGVLIPQLISGTLDEVTVSSEDVPVGQFEGDVTVTATDVPIREGVDMGGATATVTLDEAQLESLLSTIEDFPADTVALAEPDVTAATELQLFGVGFPVAVSLTPSVAEGDLVLTPTSFELAGAQIDAAALSEQFGALADVVVRDWSVCLAQYIPAGVTLTDVRVDGDVLVADADVDGGIVTDPALQANGTCE
ncbi:LmeA family phospholipid-binding protein [Microbacterium sp. HJ5]